MHILHQDTLCSSANQQITQEINKYSSMQRCLRRFPVSYRQVARLSAVNRNQKGL